MMFVACSSSSSLGLQIHGFHAARGSLIYDNVTLRLTLNSVCGTALLSAISVPELWSWGIISKSRITETRVFPDLSDLKNIAWKSKRHQDLNSLETIST